MSTININTNTISNVAKVIAYGKPFFASDLGFNGGEIRGMNYHGYIRATGKTRESFIPIDGWDDEFYRKVTVQEWELNPVAIASFKSELEKIIADLSVLRALL
jgi:hypothetical protein